MLSLFSDSSDLAAVKLLVGRPKDLDLVRLLHAKGKIDSLNIPVELTPRLLANFSHTMQSGSAHRQAAG